MPGPPDEFAPSADDRRVVEISAADTHDLRRRVLRVGTVTTEVHFAEDDLDSTFHLGVRLSVGRGVELSVGRGVGPGVEPGIERSSPGRDDIVGTTHPIDASAAPRLVAISTWVWRRHPDVPTVEGVQLRGMATDPSVRGTGCGALLLRSGLARCRDLGAGHVWARARDSALEFYLAHGFVTFGPGYTDLATALPHHDVIHHLGPD